MIPELYLLFGEHTNISGTKDIVDRVMDRIFVTEDYIQEIKKRNKGLDVLHFAPTDNRCS